MAFAKSLLADQDWFEELLNKCRTISSKEILFIWGMKGTMIKQAYLKNFMSGFPNHKTIVIETCGHFPQEENPEKELMQLPDL